MCPSPQGSFKLLTILPSSQINLSGGSFDLQQEKVCIDSLIHIERNRIMPASVSDLVGQQFGQYQLTRLLAQGENSTIYLGKHITFGDQASIRLLQFRLASTAQT